MKLGGRGAKGKLWTFPVRNDGKLPELRVGLAVTLVELSAGLLVAQDEAERAARQAHLHPAESDSEPLQIGIAAARMFGRVAASLRSAARKPAARAYDAMIAAPAIAAELPSYLCNPDDFTGIGDVEIVALPIPPVR